MLTDFERLVIQMRMTQKSYFLARSKHEDPRVCQEILQNSKSLESMVDKYLVAKVNKALAPTLPGLDTDPPPVRH